METIYYKIPAPNTTNAVIEVFGPDGMACYEWRIVEDKKVINCSLDQQYGQAEIALRDALIVATTEMD